MKINTIVLVSMVFLLVLVFFEASYAASSSADILDSVLAKYKTAASDWAEVMQKQATKLFFALVTISMVWTFAQLLFHRSSFAEFFGEFIRFILFTGVFLWFLNNGPEISLSIIRSLMQIGAEASGQPVDLSPSGIVDIGFKILDATVEALEFTVPTTWFALIFACIILMILSLVGINMLLQLCAAWVLAYAGIFFLGFGGSRWTSDMAINYYKTVLGIGASLMTMTLLIGVGTDIITQASDSMQMNPPNIREICILLVFALTLLMLVDKLPAMVAGIITGAGIGSMGVGSFGAGAAVGAAMTAGAAISGAASLGKSAAGGAFAHASKVFSSASSPVGDLRGDNAAGGGTSTNRSFGEATGVTKPGAKA